MSTVVLNLPVELIERVCDFLKFNDLETISKACDKTMSFLQDQFYWKRRCEIDFKYTKTDVISNWKSQYIFLYGNTCIHCLEVTTNDNYFFGTTVCRLCERIFDRYATICKSDAIRLYRVKAEDLENLRYFMRRNSHNRRYPMKIFLKNDVSILAVQTVCSIASEKRKTRVIEHILRHESSTDISDLLKNLLRV